MGLFQGRKNKAKAEEQARKANTGVDLSQVIRGMQHAVNEAQRTLEVHHLKSLLRFFYADGEPKSVDLHLGGTKHIDIPLVTLANHSSLKIDELEMEFKAKIQEVTVENLDELKDIVANQETSQESDREEMVKKEDMQGDHTGAEEGSATFGIGFSPAPAGQESNMISVRIKFMSAGQPEGLSRIVDEYNKLVVPYDVHPLTPEDDPPTFIFTDEEPNAGSDQEDDASERQDT